ncbi:hypothetical protein CR513_32215, partial [Mucuna pruriens]
MSRVSYASIVGSLMYAMVCTRLDIAHVIGTDSIFLSNPGREYWNAVKWILRYLYGTSDLRLCFGGDNLTLVGYSNSDMVEDIDSRECEFSHPKERRERRREREREKESSTYVVLHLDCFEIDLEMIRGFTSHIEEGFHIKNHGVSC